MTQATNQVIFKVTTVFNRISASTKRSIVCIGGSGSSKSYSTAQWVIGRFLNPNTSDRRIVVMRKAMPSLRDTAMKLVIGMLEDAGAMPHIRHNKTENILTYNHNKNQIMFRSMDDPQKIKSTEYNDVWLEEANEFTWNDYVRIVSRSMRHPASGGLQNQAMLTLNPETPLHWIKTKLIDTGKADYIHSTYKDNPFVEDWYAEELEDLKNQDYDAYLIFAKGEFAKLRNLVYQPMALDEWPDDFSEVIYGLDFGFVHPTVLTKHNIIHNERQPHIYVDPLIMQSGLTNKDLIAQMKRVIPEYERERPIYCDYAEPARITEIRQAGFNAQPADKSVTDGIDFCKRCRFISKPEWTDANKQWQSYKYRTDKNGDLVDENPLKKDDDYPDSVRYGAYTHLNPIYGHGITITHADQTLEPHEVNITDKFKLYTTRADMVESHASVDNVALADELGDIDDEDMWDSYD